MSDFKIKQRVTTIVAFLVLVGVAGVLVMVSGVVPIKASSGHWPVTRWVLNFSKARSVSTHSMGIKVPPLDDPTLVMKGAGHFETGCVQCHGSPSRPPSPVARMMTATPPPLPPKIRVRDPEELFYIVKHGIKFTGMPGWPALNRDDEVWSIVAFLLELPEMDGETYRELVVPPGDLDEAVTIEGVLPSIMEACSRCHGTDGLGRGTGAFPKLAGQSREYLEESLLAYANGDRHSGMMQTLAAILSPAAMAQLAEHYATLSPSVAGNAADVESSQSISAQRIERGRRIAETGLPDQDVPSCIDCHGPGEDLRADEYPRLAGQYADYLELQLRLFKSGDRGGSDTADLMSPVVTGLTEEDMKDVAAYYASLSWHGESQQVSD
ncbi:Cytochrome c-552 precursor [Maioricimonas rarisocia]|uniref:Cytochrome c-552 n=1 Tax=Maioricimonas rarisocia TaxID=2528026 RepID=A0A517ZEI0_9PLAN|nr:c-type cytochrome [Maioricimonas rarisocia]QDU40868.1 Cytochrome c-552 precursor [Maioricimonas rarisocia]